MFSRELFDKVPKKPTLEKKKNKMWWWVALAVLVLAIALFFVFKDKQTPEPQPDPVGQIVQPPVEQVSVAVEPPVVPVGEPVQPEKPVEPAEPVQPVRDTVAAGISSEDDLYVMAKRTIRGDFGNGEERKMRLKERYSYIQHQVNEFYRTGDLYW